MERFWNKWPFVYGKDQLEQTRTHFEKGTSPLDTVNISPHRENTPPRPNCTDQYKQFSLS